MAAVPQYEKPPGIGFSSYWTQSYPPDLPTRTEISQISGIEYVYIVTGSNTGVGKEVARILYSKNARVYLAARSEKKGQQAIEDIQKAVAQSQGSLRWLRVDSNDLATIKPAVERFTSQETKLHVLFNNAAVQDLHQDPDKTAQGFEKHFGVNILGPFLFTQLLIPILQVTASSLGEGSDVVRVVWVCSLGTEVVGERSRGISSDYLQYYPRLSPLERYGVSEAGSWLHAVEMARRYPEIISAPCNPGHLRSDLYRDAPKALKWILNMLVLYPKVNGAYTELFAGLSPAVNSEKNGQWIVPWGRFHRIRADLLDACKEKDDGGNGHAREFWVWCTEQVKKFT